MWFTETGVYYQFTRRVPKGHQRDSINPMVHAPGSEPDSFETMMIKASLVGANSAPSIVGNDELDFRCNYFIGNDPAGWRTDAPNYCDITCPLRQISDYYNILRSAS